MAKNPMRKWGSLEDLEHFSRGWPDGVLCRKLKVSSRTLRSWRTGERPVPFWVPELLRLWEFEHLDQRRQMGLTKAHLYVLPGGKSDSPEVRYG